jgi:hypothetical protein
MKIERTRIDSSSIAELEGVTFAFVCVDKGSAPLIVNRFFRSVSFTVGAAE